MNWQTTYVIILLFISAIVSSGLSYFAFHKREIPWAIPFAVMTAALAEWSVTYALEIAAPDLSPKIFWAKFQYIGISLVPVTWFLFSMTYSGREEWLSRTRIIVLCVPALLTVLFSFTNQYHHLHYAATAINNNGPFSVLDATYGIWWWIFFVYAYGLVLIGSVALFLALQHFPTAYRWQLIALMLSPLIPWIGNALYIFRLSPIPQLDLGPFTFTISALILGTAIFQFHLFDIVPIARSSVVENMSTAMFVLDTRNRIVDINPAACALFGQQESTPIGRPVAEILQQWSVTAERYADTIETKEDISLRIGGMDRSYRLQITPIYNKRGHYTGRLVMLYDITNEKLAEEALAMARVKTEFLAKVGHELRTPLNAILGGAEMIDYGVYGPVTEDQQKALRQIIERTNHLATLVNDLLEQTQLEAGQFRLYMREFPILDLINRVYETIRPAVAKKGLILSTDIATNVPRTIRSDPTRLYQILVNLVDNAVKFTNEGYIRIRVYNLSSTRWGFEVSDTGIGIPNDLQQKIFKPFQQVNFSATREYKGIGLGLAIVKQIVDMMGGEIRLQSVEGMGSTFTVVMPREPTIRNTRPAPPISQSTGENRIVTMNTMPDLAGREIRK